MRWFPIELGMQILQESCKKFASFSYSIWKSNFQELYKNIARYSFFIRNSNFDSRIEKPRLSFAHDLLLMLFAQRSEFVNVFKISY